MTGGKPLFAAESLGVRYVRKDGPAVTALADVTLAVGPGERMALIGESGSGKSSFSLALAGLLPPEAILSGTIAWPALGGGQPVRGRDVGFVFQDPAASLNPVLTIGEQVAEVVRTHRGTSWGVAFRDAVVLLDRVRLPDPLLAVRAYPHQLSGGQRQRAAIAMAIAAGPRLLIADEATSALDTVIQAEIAAVLDALVREDGMALLLVTHDIALASALADRIAVFSAGRLVETGTVERILSEPRSPAATALIEAQRALEHGWAASAVPP